MPKLPDAGDVTQVGSDLALLQSRENALRAAGKTDLADAYKRAIRELNRHAHTNISRVGR